MSKQINFYSCPNDKEMIANLLNSVFGQLLCVSYYKGNFSLFDKNMDEEVFHLTESSLQTHISYYTHEYYDGTTAEVLDCVKSPVLEYSVPFQREDMVFVSGRFYCCADNIEFSQKVSKFFGKLKKEFRYVKRWKCYISNSIDIEVSRFFVPNRVITINKEELK